MWISAATIANTVQCAASLMTLFRSCQRSPSLNSGHGRSRWTCLFLACVPAGLRRGRDLSARLKSAAGSRISSLTVPSVAIYSRDNYGPRPRCTEAATKHLYGNRMYLGGKKSNLSFRYDKSSVTCPLFFFFFPT